MLFNGFHVLHKPGHASPAMLFKNYRGLAKSRKAQAQKFFEIAPRPDGQAIEFSEVKTA